MGLRRFVLSFALVSVFLLLATACASSEEAVSSKEGFAVPASAPAPRPAPEPSAVFAEGSGVDQAITQERLVVRTIFLTTVVGDIEETLSDIGQMAGELGGFVVSTNRQGRGRDMTGSISFRVPADKTEEALQRVRAMAERVTSERSNAQDVTEEYVDLQARVRNLRATEDQYLELLRRADSVEDALKVQQALSSVRGEIERLEGRIQYLERTSSTSLISVQLLPEASQEPLVRPGWSPLETIKDAVRGLNSGLQNLADFAIRAAILSPFWLLPLIVVVALIVVLRRRARR